MFEPPGVLQLSFFPSLPIFTSGLSRLVLPGSLSLASASFLYLCLFPALIALAKLVDFECPRCGLQTRIPPGLVDVDTGELVPPTCPRCGLTLEFELSTRLVD